MATPSATQNLKVTDDVIIVGGGLAGLFCALKMAPRPVTLITSVPLDAFTAAASGQGTPPAGAFGSEDADRHIEETIAAGCGIADRRIATLMTRAAPAGLRDLEAFGVSLNGAESGGRGIVPVLTDAVRNTPSIRVIENYSVEDLVKDGSRAAGLIAIANDESAAAPEIRIQGRAMVIATGGVGALFAVTTKSPFACGEGLAIAARAGALVADTEFVQFLPAHADARNGAPAAHFHIGGVLTDANGRTSVDGLWACGEVAATGVHGANLFAPNGLLEAIVFAGRVAGDIGAIYPAAQRMPVPHVVSEAEGPGLFPENPAIDRLRHTMSEHVGAMRDRAGLVAALAEIDDLERQGGPSHGFRNMITTARLIAGAALMRAETRGAHVRGDFPSPDPLQARRSIMTLRIVESAARTALLETEKRYA